MYLEDHLAEVQDHKADLPQYVKERLGLITKDQNEKHTKALTIEVRKYSRKLEDVGKIRLQNIDTRYVKIGPGLELIKYYNS